MALLLLSLALLLSFVNSQSDSCSTNLAITQSINFNTTSLSCQSVWTSENFILRYAQTAPSLWSFVLSMPDSNSWFGVGFSDTGRMSGSSAVIGWPDGNGAGVIKQYYLGGYSRSSVQPDQGNLAMVNPMFVSKGSTTYLAFQLKVATPQSSLIYAVGPRGSVPSSDGLLERHRQYVSTSIDFTSGKSSSGGGGSGESDEDEDGGGGKGRGGGVADNRLGSASPFLSSKATHGLLNMVAWGFLLPLGIITARYYKHLDPTWFYTHLALQMTGFGLAIAGVLTGISLENELKMDVDEHKLIGFVALGLACAQVTALLIRPDKQSKFRRYWNWFHHWVGRIAVVAGIFNIFYGIRLGRESGSWNAYLGIALAIMGVCSIILEIRKCFRK